MKSIKKAVAVKKPSAVRTNAGRITRVDQAWDAAHREQKVRSNVTAIKAESAAKSSRVVDIEQARTEAVAEYWERYSADTAKMKGKAIVPAAPKTPQRTNDAAPTQTLAIPLKLVASALLIAPKADIRYYMNGVFIHAVGNEVRVCSSDGHRLIVSRFTPQKGEQIPEWAKQGVIVPRNELAQALPILQKNVMPALDNGAVMLLDFGVGHTNLRIRSFIGFAQFTMPPVDGKFPDYARILMSNASVLARGEGESMQTSAIQTAYIKSTADIASKLGANAIRAFVSPDDKTASFFTFDGAPDTVLVVMGMKSGEAVSDGVVKMLGSNGIAASISAYRAHLTRQTKLLETVKSKEERNDIEARAALFKSRIDHLLKVVKDEPKKLSAPVTA